MDNQIAKVAFQESEETSILTSMLEKGKVGDELTDEEMTRACGQNTKVKGEAYNKLHRAMRRAQKNYGIVWFRLLKQNRIRCATAPETVEIATRKIKREGRSAKRTREMLCTVNVNDLEGEDKRLIMCQMVQLATIEIFCSGKTQQKMLTRGIRQETELPRLLDAFRQVN